MAWQVKIVMIYGVAGKNKIIFFMYDVEGGKGYRSTYYSSDTHWLYSAVIGSKKII